jgi:hypothetical protein
MFKLDYKRSIFFTNVDEMTHYFHVVSTRGLSYVILVLTVKRRLGMFKTLSSKNPVSASDPRQGAFSHHVLSNFVLKGVLEHGFLLHGINNDELEKIVNSRVEPTTVYKNSARSLRQEVNKSLASFDAFTGRLAFDYKGSLSAHFTVTGEVASGVNGTIRNDDHMREEEDDEAGVDYSIHRNDTIRKDDHMHQEEVKEEWREHRGSDEEEEEWRKDVEEEEDDDQEEEEDDDDEDSNDNQEEKDGDDDEVIDDDE